MLSGCQQENCTVAETGACLLNNDPTTCPNRADEVDGPSAVEAELAPPLEEPEKNPRFPASQSLTPTEARELMGKRYCRLIGILGEPDAGKTAALVSLYLLAARGKLAGFTYADSRSLMAFDELSQGARRWNEGKIPEQMTAHTELEEGRSAGFLHLRLRPADHEEAVDLLLPDLPGEWSTAMVDSNRVDRLEFLKGADVVWLMLDGLQLSEPAPRQLALHRTNLLMQRLASLVVPTPSVILVVTRLDQAEPNKATLDALHAEARARGIDLEVVLIASFAKAGAAVAPGDGIAELTAASVRPVSEAPAFWPDANDMTASERAMMRFRRRNVS